MELKEYFQIILKRWWVVLIVPLVASCLSACISLFLLKPVYEANISLYVINKNIGKNSVIAYDELIVGQYLAKEYGELIKSRTVTGKVIDELELTGINHKILAEKINVNSKNDTRIIEIKVHDTDPERAKDIAGKIGEVFINEVINLMNVENVSIIEKAFTQETPIRPNLPINIITAFLSGLLTAIGIIFLIEYLDNTINTTEDIEKHLKLNVLGIIPLLGLK